MNIIKNKNKNKNKNKSELKEEIAKLKEQLGIQVPGNEFSPSKESEEITRLRDQLKERLVKILKKKI